MFDLEALKEMRRQADEISYACMSRQFFRDEKSLKQALDHICRTLGMFTDMEIKKLKGENIPYDPQSYMRGRMSLAYNAVMNSQEDDQYPA
ncbi:hypothetical protein D9X91_18365 [Falsibacillus albus]|uniref:Group-specific protein n=2 Tax=Falsibacillus albus TaxID=2478915 RepID=A0A3L7JSF7_9BACI|nr:hypothetical protein D9X91_18365 [Falsibacillus albus]